MAAPTDTRSVAGAHAADPFSVTLTLVDGYAFRADFDETTIEPLHTDEPPPLGTASGPSPSRLLAAAVANCLAASLVHCLRRARVEVAGLTARAHVTVGRNDRGRLRVMRIDVALDPEVGAEAAEQLARCTRIFEDYCTVTASIRDGIEVAVSINTKEPTGSGSTP